MSPRESVTWNVSAEVSPSSRNDCLGRLAVGQAPLTPLAPETSYV